MNFDFPEDLTGMRDEFRGLVEDHKPIELVRRGYNGQPPCAMTLWKKAAELGWAGTTIDEVHGGTGLGYELLCLVAEECGRTLVPLPISSTAYLVTEALKRFGTVEQQRTYLPRIVGGAPAAFALAEGMGDPHASRIAASVRKGALSGTKIPVLDADVAEFAIVVAKDGRNVGMYLVDLSGRGVARETLESLDPSRSLSRLTFSAAPAERLGAAACGWDGVQSILDRASILFAFEQVGGAQASLDMAVAYARQRYAFGRAIGSFQAIKHRLADVYIGIELARANAYYGAWALSADAPDLASVAATARVSACAAYEFAAKENIQVHGGVGCTWDFDCHLYYRRAKLLGLALGAQSFWRKRLVDQLETAGAARS